MFASTERKILSLYKKNFTTFSSFAVVTWVHFLMFTLTILTQKKHWLYIRIEKSSMRHFSLVPKLIPLVHTTSFASFETLASAIKANRFCKSSWSLNDRLISLGPYQLKIWAGESFSDLASNEIVFCQIFTLGLKISCQPGPRKLIEKQNAVPWLL